MAKDSRDKGLFQRGKRWYLRLYVRGEGRRVIALKREGHRWATTDKAIARVLARKIRQDQKRTVQELDLSGLIKEFEQAAALEADVKHARYNAAATQKFLDTEHINTPSDITAAKIQHHLAVMRKAGFRPSTLWNHRAAISQFCEFLRMPGILDTNPAREVKLKGVGRRAPVFLPREQAEKMLSTAREFGIYAEVATALYTGLRRAELRKMRWADIDFTRRVLIVPESKSDRPRTVPLSEKALTVLQDQQRKSGKQDHVFPGRQQKGASGMRGMNWWDKALKPLQAAFPSFGPRQGWHLLRHTFASWLAQEGVSIYKISEWLGHSEVTTTQIYSHLVPKYDEDIERL